MPPQTDTTPIALSPATYERHSAAVEAVEQMIQTRDPRWGTSRFPGVVASRWGRLASGDTITAASGLVLGTGQVQLCNILGGVEVEEPVTVANAGAEITASSGDKILRLDWTAGTWCVGCTGGE